MKTKDKIEKLLSAFKPSDRILVAFSGGVDSTFLLYLLKTRSNAEVCAITVKTPYIPDWEIEEAKSFCRSLAVKHKIIELGLPGAIKENPGNRCYLCKTILFNSIKKFAKEEGYNIIADGSNADDTSDYRPGLRALKELNIMSPLLEAGLVKKEIRNELKEYGLEIWDKPAYACLLTRLPYNYEIDPDDLHKIEESELFLHRLGFRGARVRLQDKSARIEVSPEHFEKIIKEETRSGIIRSFKAAGIDYISLDLEGYRTGSMNKNL